MSDSLRADTVTISGADDDQIPAYLVTPDGADSRGGVVVIHHMPGFDRATKEIARRFAELGHDAICPNLHWRAAPNAAADDAAAMTRAQGGVSDAQLLGDVAGSVDALRALPTANRKVGVIGYCSGGRQAVLAACNLDVDAAIDCYGAFVTGAPPPERSITNLVDQLSTLRCPVLGLFGNEDVHPSPQEVDEFEQLLLQHGKRHEFHRYDDTGHGFFAVDRPSYRVAAANDGWERIERFFTDELRS